MEIIRLIFVDILIPIITLIIGFFGGKAYQIKVIKRKSKDKINSINGTDNTIGNGNTIIKGDKPLTSEDNRIEITASGTNAQAAGRDINNVGQNRSDR